jgi:hypothetical protein
MGKGYIRVETKNGTEYATHFISKREGKRVVNTTIYLGKVVDIEKIHFIAVKEVYLFILQTIDLHQ